MNMKKREGLLQKTFFIKIDTRGNELNILKKGIEVRESTNGLLIEFMFTTPYETDFNFYELISFLNKDGFECKGALTIRKRPSKKVSAVDFFFVRSKKNSQTK